ncbi:DUF4153 domain-containing protein [Erythrobacter sp. CCH5-A1]|uniref:DUF4153 domain-containing protein n=1 Tax=Erythrobacter sp. CCH5-A1 TaxID=1768792 RepID=UPI00083554FD|nr:DUF4173 domain-containing protein [Erythrobacter sp. CCH5-A1]
MPHAIAPPAFSRFRFLAKPAAAAAVITVGDLLLYGYGGGSVIGGFALVWLAALILARPAVLRARGAWIALGCAALYVLMLVLEPSLLAAMLFLAAIGSAALLVRHVFDNAILWGVRLGFLGLRAPFGPPGDLWRMLRLPGRSGSSSARALVMNLVLPLSGGAVFLSLFASANPVLGQALDAVRLPDTGTLILHAILWTVILGFVWPTLRPRALRIAGGTWGILPRLPDPPVTSALITLGIFNAVFALENGLDIAFLWSGAPLPGDITLADYAHRGAYTLIATALLAGLFVLAVLRPGTALARHDWVRRLVLVWVAQNILLVASSMLRLADYIAAYSLTELRIAALVWMVLVACGLMLIGWRFATNRSAAWLINANALTAGIALTGASIVDFGAVAARWNVDHPSELVALDLCYLERLDSAALIPLIELRDAPIGAERQERAVYISGKAYAELAARQADWQAWTLRGAWRLARAEAMLAGDTRVAVAAPYGRDCGGDILPPPPPPPPVEAPEAAETAPVADQPAAPPAPVSGEPDLPVVPPYRRGLTKGEIR